MTRWCLCLHHSSIWHDIVIIMSLFILNGSVCVVCLPLIGGAVSVPLLKHNRWSVVCLWAGHSCDVLAYRKCHTDWRKDGRAVRGSACEARLLSAGAPQSRLGGPRAIPGPEPHRHGRLRHCLVSHQLAFYSSSLKVPAVNRVLLSRVVHTEPPCNLILHDWSKRRVRFTFWGALSIQISTLQIWNWVKSSKM